MNKFIFLLFFSLLFKNSNSQSFVVDSLPIHDHSKCRYFNSFQFYTGVHPFDINKGFVLGGSIVNGIQLQCTKIGVGVSVNSFGAFPLFFQIKQNFNRLPKSFYTSVDAGLVFQYDEKKLFPGGILFHPNVGFDFKTTSKTKLNLGLGLMLMSYTAHYRSFPMWEGGYSKLFAGPALNFGMTF